MDQKEFYNRADQHIKLANEQITNDVEPGEVSSSLMYAQTRFNAWIAARNFDTSTSMLQAKGEIMDYFVKEYTKMLEQNLDNYIDNFSEHMSKS
jgi:hypothetical protein